MASIRVSKAALQDIREIARHTQRQWGVDQRRSYLSGLDKTFALLADNPAISPERAEFDPPVRIHRYQRHIIVYVAETGGILVIRVLHASMDIAARLARDDRNN